jgi:outer membrane protein
MKAAAILSGIFLFLSIASLSLTARAEILTLTLEQAIDLGIQNSSAVKSARLAVLSAEEGVNSARASNYPSVSLGSSYTHLFERQTQGGTYVSSSDPVSVSAELSQNITSFGKVKRSVQLAQKSFERVRLDYEEEKRSLVVNIKRAFSSYLLAKESLEVQMLTLTFKEDALRAAEERYLAGLVPDYEVLRAESDLESFKPELIEAENQLEYARLAVLDILGLEVTKESFDIELIGTLEENYHVSDREELIRNSLQNNYGIVVSRQNISLQEMQNELNLTSKRPTVSGFANYSITSGVDPGTGEPRYWGEGSWDGNLSAGVRVQMPISSLFSWSSESAGVRQGKIDLEKLNVEYGALESTIKLQIENSLLALEKKASQISSGKKAVELALRLYNAALERYNSGLITSLDLRDVQLNLNNAQLGYLEALYGYNTSLFDLMDAVGVSSL